MHEASSDNVVGKNQVVRLRQLSHFFLPVCFSLGFCSILTNVFVSDNLLSEEIGGKNLEKKYRCPKCKSEYESEFELSVRLIKIPNKQSVLGYYCPKCGTRITPI